jgi:hypothetical protein
MRLRRSFLLFGCLFLLSTTLTLIAASTTASNTKPPTKQTVAPDSVGKAGIAEAFGKLPLSFEANRGQTNSRVQFLSRGSGYSLFLTPHRVGADAARISGGW